jgi:hypothetical protein
MNIGVGHALKTTSDSKRTYNDRLSLHCETTPNYLINNEIELIPHHSLHNFHTPLVRGPNYIPVYSCYWIAQ